MATGGIRALGSIDPRSAYLNQPKQAAAGGDFGKMLASAIDQVDQAQSHRDDLVTEMVRGEAVEVHDIMTAAEEAQLAFDLMLEVRNKLLEGYQEVMRMQV
ncbi:flagellar hook-basal body complex protein FliE [bacterium]|nr:flagellar hook-basal body complex protein FliE [bacterium]